jgi:hypothetical protein
VTVFRAFRSRFDFGSVGAGYGDRMSVKMSVDELFDAVPDWGACYLLTVSDDVRPHLLALRPTVVAGSGDAGRVLRFDAGGGRACRNVAARPDVTLVFPPHTGSDGMSLVVDGTGMVDGAIVDVTPTSVVLHRKAPGDEDVG